MSNKLQKIAFIVGGSVLVVFVGIAIAGFVRFNFTDGGDVVSQKNTFDPANTTYEIQKEKVILKDGKSQDTFMFGEPTFGDLDSDGDLDAATILVNQPGGSGTFYFAVLVLNDSGVARATNAILLGDRVSPQTVEIHEGRAVFNFAERKPGEPMTTPPSVGKSLWIRYDSEKGIISGV